MFFTFKHNVLFAASPVYLLLNILTSCLSAAKLICKYTAKTKLFLHTHTRARAFRFSSTTAPDTVLQNRDSKNRTWCGSFHSCSERPPSVWSFPPHLLWQPAASSLSAVRCYLAQAQRKQGQWHHAQLINRKYDGAKKRKKKERWLASKYWDWTLVCLRVMALWGRKTECLRLILKKQQTRPYAGVNCHLVKKV